MNDECNQIPRPDSSVRPLQERNTDFDPDQFAALCKALGHPVRVRIVERLRQLDRCVCGEITGLFPLAQSTVSEHLKILKAAGLVRGEVAGVRVCYCLDMELLDRFADWAAVLNNSEARMP